MMIIHDPGLVGFQILVIGYDDNTYDVGYFWDFNKSDRRYDRKVLDHCWETVETCARNDYKRINARCGSGVIVSHVKESQIRPEHKKIAADSWDLSYAKLEELTPVC